ncbi:MAG: aspartate aminotransferase family protein [Phycisphaerae bacterium]
MAPTLPQARPNTDALLERANKVLIPNYARRPYVFVRGEGCRLFDADGRAYLDLFAGFGGAVLGHCQPDMVAAVQRQAAELFHVGNSFHTPPQAAFAETLARTAFPGMAFFCHGGADANESAVKLARLRGMADGGRRWKTVSLVKSFHGRTLAMIAATGNPKVRQGFGPAVPGFTVVERNDDFGAVTAACDDETAAIIMEPIQGEGGVNEYPEGFAARIREYCDEQGVTLIFDEVWTGCGRTGKWFGHQHFAGGITPDVMTLGKAVGGGLPVGVMWAKPEVAKLMQSGTHGSTLGGNPVCMAAANAVFDVIERDGLLRHAERLGDVVRERLLGDDAVRPHVREIRGRGLFLGIELTQPPKADLVEACMKQGVVVNLTAGQVVRVAPPMNISEADLLEGLNCMVAALSEAY